MIGSMILSGALGILLGVIIILMSTDLDETKQKLKIQVLENARLKDEARAVKQKHLNEVKVHTDVYMRLQDWMMDGVFYDKRNDTIVEILDLIRLGELND